MQGTHTQSYRDGPGTQMGREHTHSHEEEGTHTVMRGREHRRGGNTHVAMKGREHSREGTHM